MKEKCRFESYNAPWLYVMTWQLEVACIVKQAIAYFGRTVPCELMNNPV